jgi:hypothetical protein
MRAHLSLAIGTIAFALSAGARAQTAPLAPTPGDDASSTDASPEEQAPEPTETNADGLSPEAQRVYEKKYITVTEEKRFANGSILKIYGFYRGKDLRPLPERDFFELVGRPDYESERDARNDIKWVMFIGGGALVLASAIDFAVQFSEKSDPQYCDIGPQHEACVQRGRVYVENSGPNYFVPGFMLAGGFVLLGGAFFLSEPAVDGRQLQRLADDYNTKLRRQLTNRPDSAGEGRGLRLEAAPYAGTQGGGFVLRGVF